MTHEGDPVARNRATHPRRTPGRAPVSASVLRALLLVTGAAVAVATAVLVIALAAS